MYESTSTTTSNQVNNERQTKTVTAKQREALFAKSKEILDGLVAVQDAVPYPEGVDDMDADEESRVMKEYNTKLKIASAPVWAEYTKWSNSLKPHEIRASWPTPTPEEYQAFLDDLPEGCCW